MLIVIVNECIAIGFHEDCEHHTFGVLKKGVYRPLSDFNFNFIMKVVSEKPVSTGYLVSVTQETDDINPDTSAR